MLLSLRRLTLANLTRLQEQRRALALHGLPTDAHDVSIKQEKADLAALDEEEAAALADEERERLADVGTAALVRALETGRGHL